MTQAKSEAMPVGVSRIEMLLNAAHRLPENLQKLFVALYMRNMNDEQARANLGLSDQAFQDSKHDMLKRLKIAAS